ncbi:MAG: sigma-70 family RNA polymerase sigma factor [Chitinophagales bacterium]|nr:sigma-70 family RNA polymerase sigma factor [Chitinophagales bacterium]
MKFQDNVLDFSSSLKPFAIKLTRNTEEAEDLLQETFLKAFSNASKFQEGTNLKAWLFTIMKNIFINNYRKHQKTGSTVDISEKEFVVDVKHFTHNLGEAAFVQQDLQRALSLLPAEFRVPFMMYFKGYKYHEISEQLNLPLGTIKSRIFFARRELKSKLKDYEGMF